MIIGQPVFVEQLPQLIPLGTIPRMLSGLQNPLKDVRPSQPNPESPSRHRVSESWVPYRPIPTSVRVVCANTLRVATSDMAGIRHTGDMTRKLDHARKYLSQFERQVHALPRSGTKAGDGTLGNHRGRQRQHQQASQCASRDGAWRPRALATLREGDAQAAHRSAKRCP